MRSCAYLVSALLAAAVATGVLLPAPVGASDDSTPGPDERVRLRAGENVVESGRPFPLVLERQWSEGLQAPAFDERALAPLVVRLEGVERRTAGARTEEVRRYRAWAFTLEDVVLPSRTIQVPQEGDGTAWTVRLESLHLRLRSTVDPEAPGDPELPGPPRAQRTAAAPWVVGGLLLVALGVLTALVLRRRSKAKTPRPSGAAPPPSPGARALERLARLRAHASSEDSTRATDVVEAAEVLRDYVAARYALDAPRRTTQEIRAATGAIEEPTRTWLLDVLVASDAAKFAAHAPSAEAREALLDTAVRFVERTTGAAPRAEPERR